MGGKKGMKYYKSRNKTEWKSHSFNYIDFVLEFDFCNEREMNALYNCLRQAWEWGHPPVKDDGKDEVRE